MLKLSRMGAVILPPMPAFYNNPALPRPTSSTTRSRGCSISSGSRCPAARSAGRGRWGGRTYGLKSNLTSERSPTQHFEIPAALFPAHARRPAAPARPLPPADATRRASWRAASASADAFSNRFSSAAFAFSVTLARAAALLSAASALRDERFRASRSARSASRSAASAALRCAFRSCSRLPLLLGRTELLRGAALAG